MEKIKILVIVLIILIFGNIANYNASASLSQDSPEIIDKPYIFSFLQEPIPFTVTSTNYSTTTNFTIPVSASITPKYVFVDVRGSLFSASGIVSCILVVSIDQRNESYQFSTYDFDPFGQVIFEFDEMEITQTSEVSLQLILESRSFFNRELEYSLLLEGFDLYFITPPVYNPIVIPMIHRQLKSKLLFDLDDYSAYFLMFLPKNQAFNINITSSELLKVKYMRIEDAEWVNVKNNYEFNSNNSLTFVTNDKDQYLKPKRVTFSFTLYRGAPLTLFFSSQLTTLTEVTYLPTLSSENKILVYGLNAALIGIPLGNLVKDRRKSVIKVKH